MAKKKSYLTADEHAKLPAELQAEYVQEKGGGFVYDLEPVNGWALEDVSGLKSTVSKERKRASDFEARLQAFGDDLDPVKARDALAKIGQMKDWKPEDKVREQIEAIKREMAENAQKEIGSRDKLISDYTAQLERTLVEANAVQALTKHKGNPELVLPHVKSQVRVVKDSKGNFVARVVDQEGNERVTRRSGSTDPMAIDELVETMKDRYPAAFQGTGASGSGSVNGSAAGSGGGRYTITESVARNDPRAYERVRNEATKAGKTVEVVSG